ncbi:MAG: fasciclin domain-containing protein [Bacteroidaceae bacterium]|nr:fasciclin domain-containing protein [Bacteroidaceae bacterium]
MKKMNINSLKMKGMALLSVAVSLFMGSCWDTMEGVYPNESKPSIYEEITANADLSEFKALVDQADLGGMLQAYGTYTCFAPNNAAVQEYLAEQYEGKGIADLTREEADHMVRYHIVADTLAVADFNETRLDAVNMVKQYLQTQTKVDENDNLVVTVNRNATIVDGDNRANNGFVHVIDGFLSRPQQTVAEAVENLPDAEFSILKGLLRGIAKYPVQDEAGTQVADSLKLSYFFESLNDTTYLSFLAQNNKTLELAGLTADMSDDEMVDTLLVNLVKNDLQGAYTNSQLLKNWLAYQLLPGRVYLKDAMESSSLTTNVKAQVITVTNVNGTIYLNRFDNFDESGVLMDREGDYVDYACCDGVIQTVAGAPEGSTTAHFIEIIQRKPDRVYWDLGDQPEMRALANYRKAGCSQWYGPNDLSMMTWTGKNNPGITYYCGGLPEVNGAYDVKSQYVYNDNLTIRVCINVIQQLVITTPVLVAGNYNIWLCWRRGNPGKFNTTFRQEGYEDQIMPSNVDLQEYMSEYDGDEDKAVANGWKRYNAKAFNSVHCSKNIGSIQVHTTGSHKLIMDATVGSKGDGNWWDMIQFIPVDDDQTWPRVAMDGSLVYKGTPSCQIFPDQCDINGYPFKEGCTLHDPAAAVTQ